MSFLDDDDFEEELHKREHRKMRLPDNSFYPATKILNHKIMQNGLVFLIEWTDGSKPSWETELSEPLKAEYLEEIFRSIVLLPTSLLEGTSIQTVTMPG